MFLNNPKKIHQTLHYSPNENDTLILSQVVNLPFSIAVLVMSYIHHIVCIKWPDPKQDNLAFIKNPIEANFPGHWMPISILKHVMENRVLKLQDSITTAKTTMKSFLPVTASKFKKLSYSKYKCIANSLNHKTKANAIAYRSTKHSNTYTRDVMSTRGITFTRDSRPANRKTTSRTRNENQINFVQSTNDMYTRKVTPKNITMPETSPTISINSTNITKPELAPTITITSVNISVATISPTKSVTITNVSVSETSSTISIISKKNSVSETSPTKTITINNIPVPETSTTSMTSTKMPEISSTISPKTSKKPYKLDLNETNIVPKVTSKMSTDVFTTEKILQLEKSITTVARLPQNNTSQKSAIEMDSRTVLPHEIPLTTLNTEDTSIFTKEDAQSTTVLKETSKTITSFPNMKYSGLPEFGSLITMNQTLVSKKTPVDIMTKPNKIFLEFSQNISIYSINDITLATNNRTLKVEPLSTVIKDKVINYQNTKIYSITTLSDKMSLLQENLTGSTTEENKVTNTISLPKSAELENPIKEEQSTKFNLKSTPKEINTIIPATDKILTSTLATKLLVATKTTPVIPTTTKFITKTTTDIGDPFY